MKQQFCSLRPHHFVTTNQSNILKRGGGVIKTTQVHAMDLCFPSPMARGSPRNVLPTGLVALEVEVEEEQQQHVNAKAGAEETKTKTMPLAQLFGGMEKAGGEIIHHFCTQGKIVQKVDIYMG